MPTSIQARASFDGDLRERTGKRLDEIARDAGATHFIVRLAAFAALIADIPATRPSLSALGFDNRNRIETQNIVGPIRNHDSPSCFPAT